MSSPSDLDEARRARKLGEQLEKHEPATGEGDVADALRTALSIRGTAGGDLSRDRQAAIASRLGLAPRRSGYLIAVPAIAAAFLALFVGGLLLARSPKSAPPGMSKAPVSLDQTATASVRATAVRLVALRLSGTESSRAEETLDDAADAARRELFAEAEVDR